MSDRIDVTLEGADLDWTATIAAADELPAVEGSGSTPAEALEDARALAQAAVLALALEEGIDVGPLELAALEARLRLAVGLALFTHENPSPKVAVVPTYGSDVSTFHDLEPTLSAITTQRAIAEVVARRLLTPTGSLFYDPSAGVDVRTLLNEGFTPSRVYALRAQIAAEAEADERVASASVALDFNPQTQTLKISVRVRPFDVGPFTLVLTVSALAFDLEILAAA
jgi:hypothetical protein